MNRRFVTHLVIVSTAITLLAISLRAERSPESQRTTKGPVRSKTQYVRYIAGPDAAAASRAFDAQWKAIFFYTPSPDYPYEARRQRVTGSGLFRMYVNELGKVAALKVLKSTGNGELDAEGLKAFIRWRAKPGPRREVDMPLTFLLGGRDSSPGSPGSHEGDQPASFSRR